MFERTYLDRSPREKDDPREKHHSIEKPDLPQKDLYGRKLKTANEVYKERFNELGIMTREFISREEAEKILPKEVDETSPPKAPKRKAKKVHSKSNKTTVQKI